MPSYADALDLLHAWTASERLRRHAYAVEAAMAYYAETVHGLPPAEVERWRMAGLLHDLDYERHPTPEEHPYVGVRELAARGYDEELREAILAHAPHTGVPRRTLLARTLFAVDELAGFVVAVARVRPTRLEGLAPRSVTKKLGDRAFAANVCRADIRQGAEELGLALEVHVAHVIEGLRREAARLDLA